MVLLTHLNGVISQRLVKLNIYKELGEKIQIEGKAGYQLDIMCRVGSTQAGSL